MAILTDKKLLHNVLQAQRNELTEHLIYKKLAGSVTNTNNKKILIKLSNDELGHYNTFKRFTGQDIGANKIKVFFYASLARLFGLTFGIKLMEREEGLAQESYDKLKIVDPKIQSIIEDEENHEQQLIGLIDEDLLMYISSMVLGLNDALVELTGALVGLTLALQNTRLVAIVGLITGIAASMSMAASEYLSTKQEDTKKSYFKASVYTGISYIATVALLILPYLICQNIFLALTLMLSTALLIIYAFTFYISVAKDLSFKDRFIEMAGISLGIAAINFCIGLAIRHFFSIDI
ncbi:nodulin 21-related protein [hydrothermal vent metagenome]|uniref:Nodulin 21-related protein n=1 Tax=hydrothermal vent metagenome TaxID=652676 RepID=A0A3B1DHI7_9ZZZZ